MALELLLFGISYVLFLLSSCRGGRLLYLLGSVPRPEAVSDLHASREDHQTVYGRYQRDVPDLRGSVLFHLSRQPATLQHYVTQIPTGL